MRNWFKTSSAGDFAILLGLAAAGYFTGGFWGLIVGVGIFAVLLMYAGGDADHHDS